MPLHSSGFFKRKKPSGLKIIPRNNSSISSGSSSETPSPFSPTQNPITSEDPLTRLNLDEINEKITYSEDPISNGQNGVVKIVSWRVKDKIHKYVQKRGSLNVEHENKMTKSILSLSASKDTNFPFDLFALPVAQGLDGTKNILYTCYQEIGDLQTHREYIHNQYKTNPSSVLSYLFQGFHQLLKAINALDSYKFRDEKNKIHQGIIHNDINPSNIFLKTNGDFILGDFGCAYFKDDAAPQISTLQFSAPELFTNEDFCKKSIDDINSDLWSLGASLWYLLTYQLLSPALPKKPPLSDIEKILFYQDWTKNYSEKWKNLVRECLNLTGKQLSQEITEILDIDLKKLKKNFNTSFTEQKKEILKKIALLMLAPECERFKVDQLENIMNKLEDHFVIYGETEKFATQLLARKENKNQDYNNNKLTF